MLAAAAADADAAGDLGLGARADPRVLDLAPVRETTRAALQRWILALAVVTFDLDLGPDVEFLYPPLGLSQAEQDNIAFSAFPDTSVFEQGTLVFSWRVREVPGEPGGRAGQGGQGGGAAPCAPAPPTRPTPTPQLHSRSSSYIYGYACFMQRADPSARRSYTQRSLVVLSHLPFVALFSEVAARVGRRFFALGAPVLEAFVHEAAAWPAPDAGAALTLPVLGAPLGVVLPHGACAQRPGARDAALLASVPQTSLHAALHAVLPSLWLLWELLVLGEPLLVVAPDPRTASDAVWHLLDLIRPVPCAGDFRPYFHIHDYDYAALVSRNKPPAGTLLGVTNPFFVQACAHWPHVLHLGWRVGATRGAPARVGLETRHRRRVGKDRALLRSVAELCARGEHAAANAALRQHFADLTERFLAPLSRYVASLGAPMRAFSAPDFIASLSAHSTPLPLRARPLPSTARTALYTDFLHSPNFSLWLQGRVAAVEGADRPVRRRSGLRWLAGSPRRTRR